MSKKTWEKFRKGCKLKRWTEHWFMWWVCRIHGRDGRIRMCHYAKDCPKYGKVKGRSR